MPELVARGPTIPVEVMNGLDSDRVVFFCGAGVSIGSGSNLPNFAELVDHVFDANGIEPDEVEREALHWDEPDRARRRPQLDKALGLLERPERLGRKTLRRTVIERLSVAPTAQLRVHEALIDLSRTGGGARLVTTNFDNRFLEAGLEEECIDSAPKLPLPKHHSWSSVVHLHGRIVPDEDGSNLVLTAADFGRAYLTERWAARFVTELFREFTVVFVGYSVADPVTSYIVDALAAEREMGAAFTRAFAFADYDGVVPDARQKAQAGWLAKNIEPILYNKKDGHSLLAETLVEWARVRTDPLHVRAQIALNGMKQLPAGPDDPTVERVVWALEDRVAAEALANEPAITDEGEFTKVETWLEMFAKEGLLQFPAGDGNEGAVGEDPAIVRLVDSGFQSRSPRTLDLKRKLLSRWIANHLHVPQILEWVLRNGRCMHPGLREEVQARLGTPGSDIPEELRLLWTVLLSHEPTGFWTFLWTSDHYENAESKAEKRQIADEVVEAMEPRLVVFPGPSPRMEIGRYFDGHRGPIAPLDACGHLKLVAGDKRNENQVEKILEDAEVLARSAERLTDYLEQALVLMEENEDIYMDSFFDRPSIAAHDQNRHHHGDGLAFLVDLVRDSHLALARKSHARGENLLRRWVASGQTLFRRLALHALTENEKSDISLVQTLLLAGRKSGVWELDLRREVMRFLRRAGRRLPRGLRMEVVRAIHAGPKRGQLGRGPGAEETVRRETALRMYKLMVSGAKLNRVSRALAEEGERVVQGVPDKREEFIGWRHGARWAAVGEFAPKDLVDGTAADIAAVVSEANITPEQFQGLAARQPEKTHEALQQLAAEDSWPPRYWQRFLWAIPRSPERPEEGERLREEVAQLLVRAPDDLFEQTGTAPADFVEIQAKVYEAEREGEVTTLWWRAWDTVGRGERVRPVDSNDPLTDALGTPAGRLAEAAFSRLLKYAPREGGGLPPQIFPYFEAIGTEPNGHFARVMLSRRLYHVFAIDPAWTAARLIPLFTPGHSDEAANLWYAYGSSHTIGPNLLQVLKRPFLEVLRGGEMDARTEENLTGIFMAICLEAPNELTQEEKQSVVGALSEEALKTVIACFVRRLKGDPQDRAQIWHDRIQPWIQEHWPTAEGRNTCGTSESMLGLLAESGDAFPDAAVSSLEHLQPVEGGLFHLRESEHAARHPDEMLLVLEQVISREVLAPYERGILRQILEDMEGANGEVQANPRFRTLLQIAHL